MRGGGRIKELYRQIIVCYFPAFLGAMDVTLPSAIVLPPSRKVNLNKAQLERRQEARGEKYCIPSHLRKGRKRLNWNLLVRLQPTSNY